MLIQYGTLTDRALIKDLEKLQIRAIKLVMSIKKLKVQGKTFAVEITDIEI